MMLALAGSTFFVAIQVMMMGLAAGNVISNMSFNVEFFVCNALLVLLFVVLTFYLNCKYSGTPYKSYYHSKLMRSVTCLFGVWTTCLSIKIILGLAFPSIHIGETDKDDL